MAEIHVLHGEGRVAAAVGDLVVVHVPEPGATGHQWTSTVAGDAVVEESTDLAVPEGAAPGQAGERTFAFRAHRPGSADVELTLARSWEHGPAADRLELHVSVS